MSKWIVVEPNHNYMVALPPKTIVEVIVLRLDGVEWQDAGYAENYDWSRVIEYRVVG